MKLHDVEKKLVQLNNCNSSGGNRGIQCQCS